MSSNFGQNPPLTSELAALERVKLMSPRFSDDIGPIIFN